MPATETRQITHDDFLRLEGLLLIAADHRRAMDAIQKAIAGLVGEEPDAHGYFGHASDVVWEDGTRAAELLSRMKIEVEPTES